MLDYFTLPVAVVLGFLAGLGVGGGSLLMLWLTVIVGMEYPQARVINLLFFLPSALIATLFHHKQGTVKIKKVLPAIVLGCVAAALFSFIGSRINTELLKKCFGGLLLLTGLRELFYRPRNAK
ncbi:MAG: TSUP family transporter [Oscillospiraceae bacterium]|nr:TSUP family transporter [Oscillospiraceae bacterium]